MASTYHLTEPFPNPTKQYAFTGRGGAGNITRNRPSTTFTEPIATNNNLCLVQSQVPYPPPKNLSSTTSTRPSMRRKAYTFGRGGFGNSHPSAERAMFSFDEELERAGKAAEAMAPVYHIGRGGQGNVIYDSDVSSRNSSASSTGSSTGHGFRSSFEKVRARLSRLNSYNSYNSYNS